MLSSRPYQRTKTALAADITEVIIRHLQSKDSSVSVALNEIEPEAWQGVWDAEIAPQMDTLIKNRATACEREQAIIAPVLFNRCYTFPAGDKRSGAKVVQGIEFAIIKLPASLHKYPLIGSGRNHFAKQGIIFVLSRCGRKQAAFHPCETLGFY